MIYHCFIRTTLFTAMFSMIIVVCSLKNVYTKFRLDLLLRE